MGQSHFVVVWYIPAEDMWYRRVFPTRTDAAHFLINTNYQLEITFAQNNKEGPEPDIAMWEVKNAHNPAAPLARWGLPVNEEGTLYQYQFNALRAELNYTV
jgi:hypothetical protein